MIWIAALITLWGVCATASLAVDRLPYVTLGTFWATSLIGQIFALPLMVLALGLMLFAEAIALPLLGVAAVLLAIAHWKNRAAGRALLNAVGLQDTKIPALAGLTPLLTGASKVRRIKDIAYGEGGERNQLDLVMPRSPCKDPMPILIHVHGGGWFAGKKRQQALPLLHYLAGRGWLCVDVNYRLAPKHRFPTMITDVLRAIAWVREHAHEHNGDATRIAITGGSAGGHLAALAALAHDDPAFKPAFETADCSVAAAVPLYGFFDFLDRKRRLEHNHEHFMRFLTSTVMPGAPDEAPDVWHAVSPIERVRSDAPPMFVTHGSGDSLLPFKGADDFKVALGGVSAAPVKLVKLAGLQHAWDWGMSAATWAHVRAVETFLVTSFAAPRVQLPEGSDAGSPSRTDSDFALA